MHNIKLFLNLFHVRFDDAENDCNCIQIEMKVKRESFTLKKQKNEFSNIKFFK